MDFLVLNHVNASTPTRVEAMELVAAIAASGADRARLGHLAAFFDLPLRRLLAFAEANGIEERALAAAYRRVRDLTGEGTDELDEWLDELAPAPP